MLLWFHNQVCAWPGDQNCYLSFLRCTWCAHFPPRRFFDLSNEAGKGGEEGTLGPLMALSYRLPGHAPCILACGLDAKTEDIKNQIEAEHTIVGSYVLQCYVKE